MSLKSKLIKALLGQLQSSIQKYKDFLKKPKIIVSLKVAAFVTLNGLISYLRKQIEEKSGKTMLDEDIVAAVKNDRGLQKLIGYSGKDFNSSLTSEIINYCQDPDFYSNQLNNILLSVGNKDVEDIDFLKIAEEKSDFDSKIGSSSNELNNITSKISGSIPYLLLTYYIILQIKEMFDQNDHPSPFRGKYIQNLIRTLASTINQEKAALNTAGKKSKESVKEIQEQLNSLVKHLKTLDTIIVGALLASSVYFLNRKILQRKSREAFQEIGSEQTCETLTMPFEVTVSPRPFEVVLDCVIKEDEDIVPHEPIEEKLTNPLSCVPVINQEPSVNEVVEEEIAIKALFQNDSSKTFNILVTQGTLLSFDKPMATLDGEKVYPPINGTVEKVEQNKIFVGNITDPQQTYLEVTIQKIQDLFKEQSDIRLYLQDFFLRSWYPVMLRYSPGIDDKITAEELLKSVYKTGGVWGRYEDIQKEFKKEKKDWERRNKSICNADNIKAKAEAERMDLIQSELEASQNILMKYLKADGTEAINKSQVTISQKEEFLLFGYYVSLSKELMEFFDTNSVSQKYTKLINDIMIERFFVDKFDIKKIQKLINDNCLNLSSGSYYSSTPDFFKELKKKWDASKQKIGEKFTSGESYLKDLGKKNTDLNETEKNTLVNYILFLFDFDLQIEQMIVNKYSTTKTPFQQTESEGILIEGFWKALWKRYEEIPNELDQLNRELENISQIFTTYSLTEINGEQYRLYAIANEGCIPPEDELNPRSKTGYGDMKYWLRYCSIATLMSVANPATGWSCGFPPPIGPLPFPTVYIPIKAFQVKWGIMVFGITITGIYIFPWSLFVNWSTQYKVPLADPAKVIQNEIDTLKKEINSQLDGLKKITLKPLIEKSKQEVKSLAEEISLIEQEIKENKTRKPVKSENKKASVEYASKLLEWSERSASLEEQKIVLKKNKFLAETKYKILKDVYDGKSAPKGNKNPDVERVENLKAKVDSQFEKLNSLVDKMDNFLAPLPIATKPNTANFGFTIKNPKPIIEMKDNLDDTIEYGPLEKIQEKFELKNSDLMKTNFGSAMNSSFSNFRAYRNSLKTSMPDLIKADPFPVYEKLSLTNIPWIAFLSKSWVPTGAKTYGFPGFPPMG